MSVCCDFSGGYDNTGGGARQHRSRERWCCFSLVREFLGSLGADWPTFFFCSFVVSVVVGAAILLPIMARLAVEWNMSAEFGEEVAAINLSEQRYKKFIYPGIAKRPPRNVSTDIWDSVSDMYDLLRRLQFDEERERLLVEHVSAKCAHMSDDVHRNENHECRALWMHELSSRKLVSVGQVIGFGSGALGSFQLMLEDGRMAMYKPCAGPGEWPENEVIASHIDAALGFNRVAPVVSRRFTVEEVRAVITNGRNWFQNLLDDRLLVLDHVEQLCAQNGVMTGSMIGWWSDLEPTTTFPKKLKRVDDPENIGRMRYKEDPHVLAEMVQNHLFFSIMGTLRVPGYNEYILRSGEKSYLLAVDLDRASFESATSITSELSACRICKVWKSTWDRLRLANNYNGLALAIRFSLQYDPIQVSMNDHDERTVQSRVRSIVQCVRECIEKYGESDVIVPDRLD